MGSGTVFGKYICSVVKALQCRSEMATTALCNHFRAFSPHRKKESPEIRISVDDIRKLVGKIEDDMYKSFKDTTHRYKAKYRTLMFNLRDPRNKVSHMDRKWLKLRAARCWRLRCNENISKLTDSLFVIQAGLECLTFCKQRLASRVKTSHELLLSIFELLLSIWIISCWLLLSLGTV